MHEKKQKARTTYGNTNPRGVSITLRMLTTRYDVHVSLVSLVHAYSDGRTWWMEFSAFLLFLFKFLWLTDPLLLDLRPCTSRGRMALLPHFPSDIVRVLTVMVLLPSRTFCNFLRSLPGLLLSVTLLSFSSNYFIWIGCPLKPKGFAALQWFGGYVCNISQRVFCLFLCFVLFFFLVFRIWHCR